MKLTRASSYALHAVAYMAQQKNVDKPVASHKIAEERDIPERFLLKVLKPLVTARVLVSIKGPSGGYRLARPAADINMLEIVEDRYGRGATLVTSQIPVDRWHDLMGDPTLADAILDRIVHNAHRIQLRGESVRKKKAQENAMA